VDSALLTGSHDRLLAVLSVAIAIAASYTALDLAGRVRASVGWTRSVWLATAALAMGGGIWSMHFVAMLAFRLPLPMAYDLGVTALSLTIAVLVTGLGFAVVGRRGGAPRDIALSGMLMGAGIAAMHYIGMAAMQMPADLHYDGRLVAVSVLVAIAAATTGLWLARRDAVLPVRLVAALAMGLAIAGMHYTGMAAAAWTPHDSAAIHEAHGHASFGQAGVALGVAATTFLILLLALVASLFDRRFAALAEREAKVALHESEARLRATYDSAPVGLALLDCDLRFVLVNRHLVEITGASAEARLGRTLREALPHLADTVEPVLRRVRDTGEPVLNLSLSSEAATPGEVRHWLAAYQPVRDAAGDIIGICAAVQDVTAQRQAEAVLARDKAELERLVEERTAALLHTTQERRQAEEVARQAEKLAALGQLTGGVAHDFNNILQVVMSGVALLQRPSTPEEHKTAILEGMIKASQSGRELTSRLLAFARRQTLRPEVIDVGARLTGMSELLRQTLGSRIRVETDIAPDLWPVRVDVGQLEIAILNLAVNARDAMSEGGVLTIQARNAMLEATEECAAGAYVCIAIKDTGEGMPPHILPRVLEPFFTTKMAGQGTGLGLPQVHGFAKQSGGDLRIESEPGHGTVVYFHLPRAAVTAEAGGATNLPGDTPSRALQGVGKAVLVVEDNPDVAAFACTLLEELGYATKRAGNAAEALAMLAGEGPVDAVFSDVVMPGSIGGVELATALCSSHPQVAVVLTTGYSEQLARIGAPKGVEILGKPYQPDELAAVLRRALARSGGSQKAA
jgi:PAS domain S-box-containing protein